MATTITITDFISITLYGYRPASISKFCKNFPARTYLSWIFLNIKDQIAKFQKFIGNLLNVRMFYTFIRTLTFYSEINVIFN